MLIGVAAAATVAFMGSAFSRGTGTEQGLLFLTAGVLAPVVAVLALTVMGFAGVGQCVMAVLGIVAR